MSVMRGQNAVVLQTGLEVGGACSCRCRNEIVVVLSNAGPDGMGHIPRQDRAGMRSQRRISPRESKTDKCLSRGIV